MEYLWGSGLFLVTAFPFCTCVPSELQISVPMFEQSTITLCLINQLTARCMCVACTIVYIHSSGWSACDLTINACTYEQQFFFSLKIFMKAREQSKQQLNASEKQTEPEVKRHKVRLNYTNMYEVV